MKTFATVVLSLTAVFASVIFLISSTCAFAGNMAASLVISALVALGVAVACVVAIGKLNRQSEDD